MQLSIDNAETRVLRDRQLFTDTDTDGLLDGCSHGCCLLQVLAGNLS